MVNIETKNTLILLQLMSTMKEREVHYYKAEIIRLNMLAQQNPQKKIYRFKYHLAKNRVKNLLKILKDLKDLEIDLNCNLKK